MEAIKYCNHCIQGWSSFVSCRLTQLVQQTFESECTHSSTVTHTLNSLWSSVCVQQPNYTLPCLPEICQKLVNYNHLLYRTCNMQCSLYREIKYQSITYCEHIITSNTVMNSWEKDFIQFLSGTATYIHMVTGQQVASAYFGTKGGLWSASRTCICGLVLPGEVVSPADGRRGETGKVSLWI